MNYNLTHLESLESEAVHIIREVYAEFKNPVILYSVGKDSSVLAHLMKKAFYPGPVPIPLMHIDTGYKFPEMYNFRDNYVRENNFRLIVHSKQSPEINRFDLGIDRCCKILKTEALLAGISDNNFDAAFGGARRDEEKSRAKERIFSVRDSYGQWDPKNQRPEVWNIYNGEISEKETVRVFPLSNWTELDIWLYIKKESIPVVPLYFSKKRKLIKYSGILTPIEYVKDFDELKHTVIERECRYRSLGCMPCTGIIESQAKDVDDIIKELDEAKNSERENRAIDLTSDSSMEQKKKEGYF